VVRRGQRGLDQQLRLLDPEQLQEPQVDVQRALLTQLGGPQVLLAVQGG
jgi:hypothetical protein